MTRNTVWTPADHRGYDPVHARHRRLDSPQPLWYSHAMTTKQSSDERATPASRRPEWHSLIPHVSPHVVRIETPSGGGTGFLIDRTDNGLFGVATAAHVVRDASMWDLKIIVRHEGVDEPCMLVPSPSRVILLDPVLDSAYVSGPLPRSWNEVLPETPIRHAPPPTERQIKLGVEVGWLGYPDIVPGKMCFFSGRISQVAERRYFIDGVAVPGVSGGPAFLYTAAVEPPGLRFLGSVSAYHAARLGGEAIPGLMVADDCTQWPPLISSLRGGGTT